MKGIILHGGHGTRLRPLTHTGPKQLLPIANKPMSQYCVESLREAGITDIAIIVGGIGANKVRDYYGSGNSLGVKLTYIDQDSPRGIAHAIGLCKKFIGDDKFVVFLGDNIIKRSIHDYALNFQNKQDAKASVLLCEVNNPTQFGIAVVQDGKIIKIMEKPKNPPTNLAVTGIYFLTPIIFDIINRLKPSWRNELEITDALQMLLEEGHQVNYDMVTDYWKDTGTPTDILHANEEILKDLDPYFNGIKENQVQVNGKIMIGDNTLLKSDSKITGPVIIGKNCIIGPNVDIGPNTSVGDNSIISKCSIQNSIVMSGCKIDCDVKIKDSIIGYNSEILYNNNSEMIFLLGEGTKISM